MGLEGLGIVIIILVAVAYFWGGQILAAYQTFQTNADITAANKDTAAALKIPIKEGEQICSLKVVFNPFIGANVVPPIYVRIDHGASQINWYNCYNAQPNALDLLPRANFGALDLFGLYKPSPSGYHFDGKLVADDGTFATPLVNPVPAVGLKSDLSAVGQTFTITYVFSSVPRQHYTLQMSSSEIGINQAGSGNTYYQQISP